MGSVRKLATVVIVGLVAISTLMTVYLAAEPTRRADETVQQQDTQVERGTSLYITYCLQCHGPEGLGTMEKNPDGTGSMGRTGGILNQDAVIPEAAQDSLNANFQSDDPVKQAVAEDWIRFRILYGNPPQQIAQNFDSPIVMPSFRHDLNVEQVNDLVYLIMHGDWNYVYNTAVHQTGLSVCNATPAANRTGMCEGDMHEAVAYPTVPPTAAPAGESGTPAATEAPSADGTDHPIVSTDSKFDQTTMTVKPGDTITLTNDGFLNHDIHIDGLDITSDEIGNGQSVTITIPADAQPGDYQYWCTVPGHREAGMEGTLTIEAP